jgi:hypothetical protein
MCPDVVSTPFSSWSDKGTIQIAERPSAKVTPLRSALFPRDSRRRHLSRPLDFIVVFAGELFPRVGFIVTNPPVPDSAAVPSSAAAHRKRRARDRDV